MQAKYAESHPATKNTRAHPDIHFSHQTVTNFKQRNGLSTRSCKLVRTVSETTKADAFDAAVDYCFELQCYLNDGLSRDLVINMDETPVKICTPPRTSIGKKGTGALKTTSNRNHMQQLTCMLAVTMSGRKLKPAFVCNSNQLQGHFATHASQIC